MVLIVLGSACQRGSSGPLKVERGSDGTSRAGNGAVDLPLRSGNTRKQSHPAPMLGACSSSAARRARAAPRAALRDARGRPVGSCSTSTASRTRRHARLTLYVPAGVRRHVAATVVGDGYLASLDAATTTTTLAIRPESPAAQTCAPGSIGWILSGCRYEHPVSSNQAALGRVQAHRMLEIAVRARGKQGGAPFGLRVTELPARARQASPHWLIKAPPTATGTYTWRLLVTPFVKGTVTIEPAATFEARARMGLPASPSPSTCVRRRTQTVVITGRPSGCSGSPSEGC